MKNKIKKKIYLKNKKKRIKKMTQDFVYVLNNYYIAEFILLV